MTRRNSIVFVLMMIAGVGIFYWSFKSVSMKQLVHDLGNANWWWLLVAVLAMVVYLLIESVVVKIFVDDSHGKLSWPNAVRIPLVEQFGNGITPFAAGGQPMQLITLIQAGVDPGRAGSILLMKFVVYQAMIVVNFFIAMIVGYEFIADKLKAWAWFLVLGFLVHFIVIVGLLLVMYWPSLTRTLVKIGFKPVQWIKPDKVTEWQSLVNEKIDNFHSESVRMSHDWLVLIKTIMLTLVQLLVYYLIPYFILLALGAEHVNIILVMSLHVLIVMVISLFPIPGGTGGAEIGFSMIFSTFLPNAGLLVCAMVLWRIITYYLGMFAGIIAFNVKTK
ncbi:lysylphosphatidylglycerol synthase transmembrane domain-containing protein [Weissella sagaensis]|uniref:lysylphosphatidylglycerol synthase transmembrane domain-containing protein n=1 Tax=Weissella sagaensis TaxID=2559928 RepID=UPI0013EA4097|nr:lysylphosphatidylglycerol synthase transmembrane domain-containing protein [Weissella sagaensis]